MNGIFDSHAHYDDQRFEEDRAELLPRIHREGVEYIMTIGADLQSSRAACRIAEQYDFIYFAAGIHPEQAAEAPEDYLQALRRLAAHPKCRAIGEIGLDYYWVKDEEQRKLQREIFIRQLDIARQLHLPVCVHDREAHGDTLAILKKEARDIRGVMHCYSGSLEMARELMKLDWFIGVDGPLTFKNAAKLPEIVQRLPLERILVETDCPYTAPVPVRGKRNEPAYVYHVAAKLAELISSKLVIPTIGIGAGAGCDGQILVYQDMLGLFSGFKPKFVKHFAELGEQMKAAFRAYDEEVKAGTYPAEEHTFKMDDDVLQRLY